MLGLGNPGARYEDTRHNVGVRVTEALIGRWKARPIVSGPEYRAWEAAPGGRAVTLMRSQTWMNESGRARRFFWYEMLVMKSQTKGPISQRLIPSSRP